MFKFTFETVFKSKAELQEEIKNLLWQVEHTWPAMLIENQTDWIKKKVDQGWIKINGGYKRQRFEITESLYKEKEDATNSNSYAEQDH